MSHAHAVRRRAPELRHHLRFVGQAQLADTNLTNANFLGATGGAFGAQFAYYSNTTCPDGVIAGDVATPTCVGHGFN